MKFIILAILYISVYYSNAAAAAQCENCLPKTVEVEVPFLNRQPIAVAQSAATPNCQLKTAAVQAAPSCQPKPVAVAQAPVPNCQPKPVACQPKQQNCQPRAVVYQQTVECQPQSQYYCLIKSVPQTSIAISRVLRTQFQHAASYSSLSSSSNINSNNQNAVIYLDNQYDRNRFNNELSKHREHMQDFGSFYRIYEEPPQCNREFCENFGDGVNFFKLCSPEHCHCANGNAFLQTCGTGTVFDPRNKVCNWPRNVIGCNL